MSTANENATPLMPTFRQRALDGAPRTMIAEWSAPPGADIRDPAVWRAATPHWTDARGELMAAAVGTKGFRYQWLNMWDTGPGAEAHWLPGWGALPAADVRPTGGTGAVEVSGDRALYGCAAALLLPDGKVTVETSVHRRLEGALTWLGDRAVWRVHAGLSVAGDVIGMWETVGAGVKETHRSTPWFQAAVRDGLIVHDHDPATADQVAVSRVTETETGPVLSAKRSAGRIPAVKAAAWAAYFAATEPAAEMSIW
jgi:hypothetical protein